MIHDAVSGKVLTDLEFCDQMSTLGAALSTGTYMLAAANLIRERHHDVDMLGTHIDALRGELAGAQTAVEEARSALAAEPGETLAQAAEHVLAAARRLSDAEVQEVARAAFEWAASCPDLSTEWTDGPRDHEIYSADAASMFARWLAER